jgi:hypothetical protein
MKSNRGLLAFALKAMAGKQRLSRMEHPERFRGFFGSLPKSSSTELGDF